MRLYNTMTRSKEEFTPLEQGRAGLYVCGPTVYNLIHIGNARPAVVFDTLRRYLIYKGYKTAYVQNFTDVDDKIIRNANEEGVEFTAYANRYIEEALTDMRGLNVMDADAAPRATDEMDGIIAMIEGLIAKGYAYPAEGGDVFFEVSKKEGYGKLSRKELDELEAGARIDVDERKRDAMDFALWKAAKPGEPAWPSPWGLGRPGWHIECSVMAKKHLGDTFDIHAGGEDLIFPHHENEIAQSEAANGAEFAKYWMHNGSINMNNRKMSKSLGNFFTIRDLAKDFSYETIRFFLLSAHYRSPVNFSPELLSAAGSGLERITGRMARFAEEIEESAESAFLPGEDAHSAAAGKFLADFENRMDDDLNTADAIAVIFDMVKYANVNLSAKNSKPCLTYFRDRIKLALGILGIKAGGAAQGNGETETDKRVEELIALRQAARTAKDFAEADRLRGELSDMGVIIEDKAEGVRWSYKKK